MRTLLSITSNFSQRYGLADRNYGKYRRLRGTPITLSEWETPTLVLYAAHEPTPDILTCPIAPLALVLGEVGQVDPGLLWYAERSGLVAPCRADGKTMLMLRLHDSANLVDQPAIVDLATSTKTHTINIREIPDRPLFSAEHFPGIASVTEDASPNADPLDYKNVDFVTYIKAKGLTGLHFQPVWNSVTGNQDVVASAADAALSRQDTWNT